MSATPPIGPLSPDDTEIVTRLEDLYRREAAHDFEPAPILFGPWTAFITVSALQLAWRHPELDGRLKDGIEHAGRRIQSLFGPPLHEALERGWDPAQDVDRPGTAPPAGEEGPPPAAGGERAAARNARPLDALRQHWGEEYDITHDTAGGVYIARHIGSGTVLEDGTVEGLRCKIVADYMPRSRAAAEAEQGTS